ncbi:hypothetical protein B0H16DRAFT_1527490 [Mycena metata]|uniref:Uncharacterized protein n=1 Tax=Mycena metata TaxID=1033252 RepID=A0AAD7NJS5_9AGAR|nr:hypothetical protein B0H16DRAFT_1527490 [Mycena metata]
MFKPLGIAMLSVAAVAAFDTSNFFTSQINLQNAALVFGADTYSAFPANASQLGAIASHVKACSDLYDAAIISMAAISPLQFPGGPLFSDSDAQLLNSTYVPATQNLILRKLDTLQATQAFFESVNNAPLFLTSFCHWVGTLAEENIAFLNLLILNSPAAYQPLWAQLRTEATTQYNIWLTEDGFNCGSNFCSS